MSKQRVDKNEVTLVGKVLTSHVFDPNGRSFTSGFVTLKVSDNQIIPLSVKLSITQKFDETKLFNQIFQQGAMVAVTKGIFSSYIRKPKNAGDQEKEVFQIEAPISGCYNVVHNSICIAIAVVSGVVESTYEGGAVVTSNYWSKNPQTGKGTMKSRRLLVEGILDGMEDKHITMCGTVYASKERELVLFPAEAIVEST